MTPERKSGGADAVGAYRDKDRGTRSPLPWILGGLAALVALLVLLWLFGVFSSDDDAYVDDNDPAVQTDDSSDRVAPSRGTVE